MSFKLIKVSRYFRGFNFESVFVANEDGWKKIEKWCCQKKEVYFGEIAGKHSELTITFKLEDFKVVSEDQDFITKFVDIVGSCVGVSVIGHMYDRCDECGEEPVDEDATDNLCTYCRGEDQ